MSLVLPDFSPQSIDAADWLTPFRTLVDDYNGGIDNDNISATANISGTKLADGSIANVKITDATITGAKLVNSTVTTGKLKPTTGFPASYTGGDFTTTNTTYTDVTNGSTTYASGSTAERVMVFGTAMIANDSAGQATFCALTGSGTSVTVQLAGRARAVSTAYVTVPLLAVLDVPASTTLTIKFQVATSATGTARFGQSGVDATWKLSYFVIGNI
jgi:hypothetical protein